MSSEVAYQRLLHEWTATMSAREARDRDTVARWETDLTRLCADEASIRSRGQWRSGGRTLLRAMGVHDREVYLCAALAWLISPQGWHGLGAALLSRLLHEVGAGLLDDETLASAHVVTEEWSEDQTTRADIIIRVPTARLTVVIEAKVWAGEQGRQAQRLTELWADESPVLVFLTRTGTKPTTAGPYLDQWQCLTWHKVAGLLRDAVADAIPQPGVLELLETLEYYGGKPR